MQGMCAVQGRAVQSLPRDEIRGVSTRHARDADQVFQDPCGLLLQAARRGVVAGRRAGGAVGGGGARGPDG